MRHCIMLVVLSVPRKKNYLVGQLDQNDLVSIGIAEFCATGISILLLYIRFSYNC